MTSTPRNSPCPCGSGKKYKRCCINKADPNLGSVDSFFETIMHQQEKESKSALKGLRKFPSADVLKMLSLLQLQPGNHGKNIRLENAIIETLSHVNLTASEVNLGSLIKELKVNCKIHYAEDPPEEFFTEYIVFDNGNNIVFPGISANGTEIVQGLLDCLSQKDIFPDKFVSKVKEGVLLILHIHDSIAVKLGFTHRMFEESFEENLSLPNEPRCRELLHLCSFNRETINSVCDLLKIPQETFDFFVYDWKSKGLRFDHHDANPLFQQPFIEIGDEFILVMPTAELICLNDFIINLAEEYGCLDRLLYLYAEQGVTELFPYLGRMRWHPETFSFSDAFKPELFIFQESLWRVDVNKVVYVTFLTEHPKHTSSYRRNSGFSNQYQKRVEHQLVVIKQVLPGSQVMVLGITQKSRVLGILNLSLQEIKNCDYFNFFSLLELQVLTRVWKFDRLTLWKYTKYLRLAEEKIHFAPLNTHYSKFKWYQRNEESFSDPVEEPYNNAAFGFEIEGAIRRKGLLKLDKIGIPFPSSGISPYVQCYRKEEYYSVYISQAVNYGHLHSCLFKYSCPIWFMPATRREVKAEVYINGLLYWLNELYDYVRDFVNQLGQKPVIFVVSMDESFNDLKDLDIYDDQPANIKYIIDKTRRRIDMKIPVEIVQYTSSPLNKGEQYLMQFVLEILGELIEATGVGVKLEQEELSCIIETAIPLGNQKMIVTATGDRNLAVAEIDIDDARTIPKADVSFLLENQVKWLNYTEKVPKHIAEVAKRSKLLNDLVSLHFGKVVQLLKGYDAVTLLIFLMRRHEALIQERSFRKITYPVKLSCYGKFYDVYEEFASTERELVFGSLAARVLIEFAASLMSTGKQQINDDDADMLLAHIGQIIHFGSLSDEIHNKIREIEVGLLPSGRIGVKYMDESRAFENLAEQVYGEEFDSYTEKFSHAFYRRSQHAGKQGIKDDYHEYVNTVFKEEWGIGLYDLFTMSDFIAHYLFSLGKSVIAINERELFNAVQRDTDFSELEFSSYIKHIAFLERTDILKPPEGFAKEEVYPWRYNRRLSYITRPIIRIRQGEEYCLLISARHLWMASENIVSNFWAGILKVAPKYKRIGQLIADQNSIKGKEYREEVYQWLLLNTGMQVFRDEKRIRPRGFFRATKDFGDIDILAVDNDRKIVYSIECKNTHQSKVAYEYRLELDSYLGTKDKDGLISKHIKRDIWLHDNKEAVLSKLEVTGEYRILSLVVSKHILPTKFLARPAIAILSFYELKKNGMPGY